MLPSPALVAFLINPPTLRAYHQRPTARCEEAHDIQALPYEDQSVVDSELDFEVPVEERLTRSKLAGALLVSRALLVLRQRD